MKRFKVTDFTGRIFREQPPDEFNALCMDLFSFQFDQNLVYRQYCELTGKTPDQVTRFQQIPFLPIEFYKSHRVAVFPDGEQFVFHSSGTTGDLPSTHYIFNPALYRESILRSFHLFYGHPEQYCFAVLTPTPEERPDSSLAFMAGLLIRESHCQESGFFLGKEKMLAGLPEKVKGRKIFLLGLSFALADLAEQYPGILSPDIVMETGGMKGRREEITRMELHRIIGEGLGVQKVHSEYSMCELFSQAYSTGDGIFRCPPWMRFVLRDPHDPLGVIPELTSGGINLVDLANIYTCPFIATQDLGSVDAEGGFTVLGRFDNSALRGCSLLLE